MDRVAIVQGLRARGWSVQEHLNSTFRLPPEVAARYPRLPGSLLEFLSGLALCADATETTWILCQSDYDGTSDSAFSWDEWEKLSLSVASNPDDIAKVRMFWDGHFPFMFSVGSGYVFHAVCTAPDKFGRVVEGCGPDFEEVLPVADSFEEFITSVLMRSAPPNKSMERTRER